MTNGRPGGLQQKVVPTDKDTWYRLKVTAQGGHFTCYDDDKMIFDFDDSKIAKGKIGLRARDDSQAQFDDVKITILGTWRRRAVRRPQRQHRHRNQSVAVALKNS